MKKLYILAGANGSGKSTIARELLPAEGLVYVNPDDIAHELCPENLTSVQIEAGKEALRRIDRLLTGGTSFAIESTLSGNVYVKVLERARALGYYTAIAYTFVDSPEECIKRIAVRVKRGGHYVPDEDVRRRYARSLKNFMEVYAPLVDAWTLIYNGSDCNGYVAEGVHGKPMTVFDNDLYRKFEVLRCQN